MPAAAHAAAGSLRFSSSNFESSRRPVVHKIVTATNTSGETGGGLIRQAPSGHGPSH